MSVTLFRDVATNKKEYERFHDQIAEEIRRVQRELNELYWKAIDIKDAYEGCQHQLAKEYGIAFDDITVYNLNLLQKIQNDIAKRIDKEVKKATRP